jgi:hypothetical protein
MTNRNPLPANCPNCGTRFDNNVGYRLGALDFTAWQLQGRLA